MFTICTGYGYGIFTIGGIFDALHSFLGAVSVLYLVVTLHAIVSYFCASNCLFILFFFLARAEALFYSRRGWEKLEGIVREWRCRKGVYKNQIQYLMTFTGWGGLLFCLHSQV